LAASVLKVGSIKRKPSLSATAAPTEFFPLPESPEMQMIVQTPSAWLQPFYVRQQLDIHFFHLHSACLYAG
jgi:hypothetical protein